MTNGRQKCHVMTQMLLLEHPSLFDLHLEPLHPRFHLFIHHHRVDPSIQGHLLWLWFISSDHPKSLLPPFDGLTHLCLFQRSRGCCAKSVCSLFKEIHIHFSASTGYLSSPLLLSKHVPKLSCPGRFLGII